MRGNVWSDTNDEDREKEPLRLDKYLADLHIGSRQDVKKLIRNGAVTVDGNLIREASFSVGEQSRVSLHGKTLTYRSHFYYMLNKPSGVLTATEDPKQKTVLDLLPENLRKNLSPVGRLDKDTVGLLLLTDDGALNHRLLAPRSHVDKVYLVRTDLPMTGEDAAVFEKGMTLSDGTVLLPAELSVAKENPLEALITLREGKYHQIKRMLAECGKTVVYLKRLSMGSLLLDPSLEEGCYRELTQEELSALLRCCEKQKT